MPPPRLQLHGGGCFTWPSLCLVQALSCQWLSCWCLISVLATWPLAFLCCGHMEAGRLMHCMHIYSVVQSSVREHVFYVFQISKNLDFFPEMTCQKVTSRYRKFRAQSFEMSSHTSLCDHRNSFQLFIVSLVYLRTYRHLSHTVLSCMVSCECEHYVHISARGV